MAVLHRWCCCRPQFACTYNGADAVRAVKAVTRLLLLPLGGPPSAWPPSSCALALPSPAGVLRPAKSLRAPAPGPPLLGPSSPSAHHSLELSSLYVSVALTMSTSPAVPILQGASNQRTPTCVNSEGACHSGGSECAATASLPHTAGHAQRHANRFRLRRAGKKLRACRPMSTAAPDCFSRCPGHRTSCQQQAHAQCNRLVWVWAANGYATHHHPAAPLHGAGRTAGTPTGIRSRSPAAALSPGCRRS